MCGDCKESDSSQARLLFMLNAIIREVTCMNPSVFNERFQNNCMAFTRYGFGAKAKTNVKISMDHIKLDIDESE